MDEMNGGEQSATTTLLKQTKKAKSKVSVVSDSALNDWLLMTATEIENLSEGDAYALVGKILDEQGVNDFRLGGVLAVIQENGWLEGHESFKALCEQKFGLHYRKAMYLIQIYSDLVDNQIPWEKVKNLGWTKLKEIAHILTPENVDEWVKKAEALTVLQLQEAVKVFLKKAEGSQGAEGATTTSTVTTLTFKLHADQKETIRHALDKAKAEAKTEFDTVALEAICIGYLGGSVQAASATAGDLKGLMTQKTFEEVLEIFEQVFPQVELTAVV
jgi:hypothetical protein